MIPDDPTVSDDAHARWTSWARVSGGFRFRQEDPMEAYFLGGQQVGQSMRQAGHVAKCVSWALATLVSVSASLSGCKDKRVVDPGIDQPAQVIVYEDAPHVLSAGLMLSDRTTEMISVKFDPQSQEIIGTSVVFDSLDAQGQRFTSTIDYDAVTGLLRFHQLGKSALETRRLPTGDFETVLVSENGDTTGTESSRLLQRLVRLNAGGFGHGLTLVDGRGVMRPASGIDRFEFSFTLNLKSLPATPFSLTPLKFPRLVRSYLVEGAARTPLPTETVLGNADVSQRPTYRVQVPATERQATADACKAKVKIFSALKKLVDSGAWISTLQTCFVWKYPPLCIALGLVKIGGVDYAEDWLASLPCDAFAFATTEDPTDAKIVVEVWDRPVGPPRIAEVPVMTARDLAGAGAVPYPMGLEEVIPMAELRSSWGFTFPGPYVEPTPTVFVVVDGIRESDDGEIRYWWLKPNGEEFGSGVVKLDAPNTITGPSLISCSLFRVRYQVAVNGKKVAEGFSPLARVDPPVSGVEPELYLMAEDENMAFSLLNRNSEGSGFGLGRTTSDESFGWVSVSGDPIEGTVSAICTGDGTFRIRFGPVNGMQVYTYPDEHGESATAIAYGSVTGTADVSAQRIGISLTFIASPGGTGVPPASAVTASLRPVRIGARLGRYGG